MLRRVCGRLWLLGLMGVGACEQSDLPGFSFYQERINPILDSSCARQNVGCHVQSDGVALGNLDLSSYDSLMRRRDALGQYGPYQVGLLLLKAGGPVDVQVETFDPTPEGRFVAITTDIRHNAGDTVNLGSTGYARIKQWIESGHTRTGAPDETLAQNLGACRSGAGHFEGFDPAAAPADSASFQSFVSRIQPIFRQRCAGSGCHGSPIADLYLACGDSDEELRWNYWVTVQHLSTPASTSGLLRRPLSTFRGGVFHEGGNVFASTEDPDYRTIRDWAEELVNRVPDAIAPPQNLSAGLRYFADRVQPVLVRKGCMFLNCHSPSMFHDLRLRGGAEGHFSRIATLKNYEMSRLLLSPESEDPNESRIIAKNLFPPEQPPGVDGIVHRGGALFEDFGISAGGDVNLADPSDCGGFDVDAGDLNTVPAYCVMARWHQLERQDAIAAGEVDTQPIRSVFWVARSGDLAEARDFDTYRAGADLRSASATLDAAGDLSLGADSGRLGGCAGLSAASADIRGVAVSWDGARVAFGARNAADQPLRLWWMNADGSGCERIPGIAPASDLEDGILTHDFDPAFAPDGRLVFASSRGNLDASILGRGGPTRTPAALQPNANLYIAQPGANAEVRQLTYLLNQEFQPGFMADGRVIFTAEKREPDFHQLAGRRQNLDGGDYHPLFAQRASVGFSAATDIVEQLDRNLAMVASPIGAVAGTVAVVNRSLGPDQDDRDPNDRAYLPSRRFPFPSAFSAAGGSSGTGAYRALSILPSGRLLAACDRAATSLTQASMRTSLCELDPDTGSVRVIRAASGGAALDEPVAVFRRLPREVFTSRIDEANGRTEVITSQRDAVVRVLDVPMLGSLLFANTRVGRDIDRRIGGLEVLAEYPPPAGGGDFAALDSVVTDDFGPMFLDRRSVGKVGLNADGSAAFSYPGGLPIVLGLTDRFGGRLTFREGAPFSGEMIQREQMQFYPGERSNQSFRRELFNAMCGGCHGSSSGRELDIAADVDVLTHASDTMARTQSPTVLAP